ncbi:hypothetical protein F4780DRAFT_784530 [Xylariomycetidae sp. FL0641]|nr:hypothetical protein F4780DRAFT_784530 [Xylariomycetidae sp. FL0641]
MATTTSTSAPVRTGSTPVRGSVAARDVTASTPRFRWTRTDEAAFARWIAATGYPARAGDLGALLRDLDLHGYEGVATVHGADVAALLRARVERKLVALAGRPRYLEAKPRGWDAVRAAKKRKAEAGEELLEVEVEVKKPRGWDAVRAAKKRKAEEAEGGEGAAEGGEKKKKMKKTTTKKTDGEKKQKTGKSATKGKNQADKPAAKPKGWAAVWAKRRAAEAAAVAAAAAVEKESDEEDVEGRCIRGGDSSSSSSSSDDDDEASVSEAAVPPVPCSGGGAGAADTTSACKRTTVKACSRAPLSPCQLSAGKRPLRPLAPRPCGGGVEEASSPAPCGGGGGVVDAGEHAATATTTTSACKRSAGPCGGVSETRSPSPPPSGCPRGRKRKADELEASGSPPSRKQPMLVREDATLGIGEEEEEEEEEDEETSSLSSLSDEDFVDS